MNRKVIDFKEAKNSEKFSMTFSDKESQGTFRHRSAIRAKRECYHLQCIYDETTGFIECTKCGEKMSPERWVYNLAFIEVDAEKRLFGLNKMINKYFYAECPDCGKKHRVYPKK